MKARKQICSKLKAQRKIIPTFSLFCFHLSVSSFELPVLVVALFLFCPLPVVSQEPSHPVHEKITLRGFDGRPLTLESKTPYSPRKTCGSCHDYDQITNAYHFQQGRTNASGKIVMGDSFDPKHPWNLSSGMFGKYSPGSMDASLLARKVNSSPSDIDKSAFAFLQICGPCHPGGGFGEYDRDGNPYYNEGRFGYELAGTKASLDGDYTSFAMGRFAYAAWDRSGPSEADCLICHLKGFQWTRRAAALRGKFFKEAPTVGAGWAKLKLSEDEVQNARAKEIFIDYTLKETADFERLNEQILRTPTDDNCWSCHGTADGRRHGRQWSPETDVHNAKNMGCITCHRSDKGHNFAKGNTLPQTVRDDLDNTMYSCEDCHYKGKDKKAPRYKHPFSPRHMSRIACQTCHIPYLTASADLVYDNASTGTTIVYDTSRFLSNQPLDPRTSLPGLDPNIWYPSVREFRGRIVPVKSLVVVYWGDLDEKAHVVQPIALWKIRESKRPPLNDDNSDGIPEVNSLEEIKAFLNALKEKDRFGNPIAREPVLVKGEFLYRLDKKAEVEKIRHEQVQDFKGYEDYSLSHNVIAGTRVIGANGCTDCHCKDSPFFLRKILIDPYDERGKPIYIEAWQRLGLSREKLDRLLAEQ